jgi:heme-degrading monooxygenase HmoA
MISRIWHGWTTPDNEDKYEALLKEEIFAGIQGRHIRGFKSIQLLRRDVGREVEFVTIMLFDTLDAVREFAGQDYEAAVVPEKARAVLSHFDERSQHYELIEERIGEGSTRCPACGSNRQKCCVIKGFRITWRTNWSRGWSCCGRRRR